MRKITHLEKLNKIIADNPECFTDTEYLSDFIDSYIYDDKQLSDIEDCVYEYADTQVPIYYCDIRKEWSDNGECQGLTPEMLGEYAGDDIHNMMMSDLSLWYSDRLKADYDSLLELTY